MKKHAVIIALLGLLLSGLANQAFARGPAGGAVPELVGTLDDWNFNAGYLVLNGNRYPAANRVEVILRTGEAVGEEDLERGAYVGVVEVDGQVRRIVLFR